MVHASAGGSNNTISLISNWLNLGRNALVTAANAGTVAIQSHTPNTSIHLGAADGIGILGLTDLELDRVAAGTLQIGDVNANSISILNNITRTNPTNMSLISGSTIQFLTGSINTTGGNLRLSPGSGLATQVAKAGNDALLGTTGTLSFAPGSVLSIAINGLQADTLHDQLKLTGLLDLTGVALSLTGSYVPNIGDRFTIINNDSTDEILGTFEGLAEGATLDFQGIILQISYHGGSGNDVVLTALSPE